jgi:hypothetical protein
MAKIHDQEASLLPIPSKVTSSNLNIKRNVQEAESVWEGKTENNADVRETLREYWALIGKDHPPSIAWSAAFISYLLRDHDFVGHSYHTTYVDNAMDGTSKGWQAFSIPKNTDKLVVSVGDVLVAPRSGSYQASHGDVVYNIREGAADLIGGNISDTLGFESIGLNPDGTISNPKRYLVLLKKNPMSVPMFYTKRVFFYGLLPMLVLGGTYYGYQYYQANQR